MSEIILKYKLEQHSIQEVSIPKDATILCVQSQVGIPTIWVLAEDDNEPEIRYFKTFETGAKIKPVLGVTRKYIGTCQFNGGLYVTHIFEYINNES